MKTIIVTGPSPGIGHATAELFLSRGWIVGLLARSADKLQAMMVEGCTPEPSMDVADAARSVLHMAGLSAEANVRFMTVMAMTMPYIGRV